MNVHVLLAFPMLLALAAGCARKPIEHTVHKVPADATQQNHVAGSEDQGGTDASEPPPSALQQTKAEFEGILKDNVEKLEEQVRELQIKAGRLEQSAQAKWAEHVVELEARRKTAREKLDEVARSSGEAWKHLRDGADNAWQEVGEGRSAGPIGVLTKPAEKRSPGHHS